MPADQVDHAIAEDVSVDAFRQIAFDRMADEAASRSLSAIPRVTRGGLDETETRRAAMINSLLHRSDPGHVPLEDPAREYRGLSLIELARDCLEVSGHRTRGLSRSEIATRAFHSTSDFPFILENVATKSLRAAYNAYQSSALGCFLGPSQKIVGAWTLKLPISPRSGLPLQRQ